MSEPVRQRPPSEERRELDEMVARLLPPLCFVLSGLYASYVLTQEWTTLDPRVETLRAGWLAAATVFLVLGLALRRWTANPRWAHPLLALTALLVLANSLRVLFLGGPFFSNVLILVMLGYATLALSIRWLLGIVVATFLGWFAVAWFGPPHPEWQPAGIILFSAAAVAVLTQALRLYSFRRIIRLRHHQIQFEKERHEREQHRLRVDLINAAAHEVATPLTPILIQLYSLRETENPTPTQLEKLAVIDRNMERLRVGVQNIQRLSSPEARAST